MSKQPEPKPVVLVAVTIGNNQETFKFEHSWQAQDFLEAAKERGLQRGQILIGTSDTKSKDWKQIKKFLETY